MSVRAARGGLTAAALTALPAVVTLVSETFPGANGAAWPAQWTTVAGGGGTADQQNGAGRLLPAAGNYALAPLQQLSGMTQTADVTVTLDFTSTTSSLVEQYFTVGLRSNGTFDYSSPQKGAHAEVGLSTGTVDLRYSSTTGGGGGSYTTGTYAAVAAATYRMEFTAKGTTFEVRVWNLTAGATRPTTATAAYTDAGADTTAGYVVLSVVSGGAATAYGVLFDNVIVTAAASASTGGPSGGNSSTGGTTAPETQNSPMPTASLPGWTYLKGYDFTTDSTKGSDFLSKYPGWDGYSGNDTSGKGTYSYAKVLDTTGGNLRWYVHSENGTPYVAAPIPPLPTADQFSQLYGRYAVRFKSDVVAGYKVAWLLWPAEPNGWSSGEVDFPEADLGDTIGGFAHQVDGNPAINQYQFNTGKAMTDWHVAVIEWTPGSLKFFLDGALVGSTTDPDAVPHVKCYWVLQTETTLSGTTPTSSAGYVYADWVAAWSYTP